jgi:hypothetical protein
MGEELRRKTVALLFSLPGFLFFFCNALFFVQSISVRESRYKNKNAESQNDGGPYLSAHLAYAAALPSAKFPPVRSSMLPPLDSFCFTKIRRIRNSNTRSELE